MRRFAPQFAVDFLRAALRLQKIYIPIFPPSRRAGGQGGWGFALIAALMWLFLSAAAPLQDGYTIIVNKTNGFNNGSQIRGSFRAELIGPGEGVRRVSFLVDGQAFADLSAPPYRVNFKTTDFPDGPHSMSASVEMQDGRVLQTPERHYTFVSAQTESDFMRSVLFPILGGVFVLMLVGVGFQFLAGRRSPNRLLPPGSPRHYGIKGGGICPRCHRPFGLHWWSANLIAGVYDRCDFCGRWGFIRPASAAELASAEAAEAAEAQAAEIPREKSEEEKLKDLLDNSRFSG